MRQRFVSKALALTLCVQLTCPTALLEAAATSQATLPAAPLKDADLNGTWLRANGAAVSITQNGEEVSATLGPLVFRGTLRNGRLSLDFRFERIEDMPASFEASVRPKLLGKVFRLTGIAAEPNALDLQFFGWELNPGTGEVKESAPSVVKLTRAPIIRQVIVVDDQTAVDRTGRPLSPYPVSAGARSVATRRLLVIGHHLPDNSAQASGSETRIESRDKAIAYKVLYGPGGGSGNTYQPVIEKGWHKAFGELPLPERYGFPRGLATPAPAVPPSPIGEFNQTGDNPDLILLEATLSSGVLPGPKVFRLSGIDTIWTLAFGDVHGRLQFVRSVSESETEVTNKLFAPEDVFVEIKSCARAEDCRTGVELPIDELRVEVQRNQRSIGPNRLILTAKRQADRRTYRTPAIQLIPPTGRPSNLSGEAVVVGPNDELQVRLVDPTQFRVLPEIARAIVEDRPTDRLSLWKQALVRAAVCQQETLTGSALDRVANEKVEEISNVIITERIANLFSGRSTNRTVDVRRFEHAAMLLLADEFIDMMRERTREMPVELDDRRVRQVIEAIRQDPDFPLGQIEVYEPERGAVRPPIEVAPDWSITFNSGLPQRVELNEALSPSFLARHFPTPGQGEQWARAVTKGAWQRYRELFAGALRRAIDARDCNVRDLVLLTGSGFEPVVARLLARLVRFESIPGESGRWVADPVARAAVRGIRKMSEAIRAQRDYSSLDSQVVAASLFFVTLPALFTGSAIAAVIAVVADVSATALSVQQDVRDYLASRDEYDFTRGASSVVGPERLTEAELRRIPFWSVVLSGAGAALLPLSVVSTAIQAGRAVSQARSAALLRRLEDFGGNVAGFKKLSVSEQTDVLSILGQAKQRQAGDLRLDFAQQRAVAAADKLEDDLRRVMAAPAGPAPVPVPRPAPPGPAPAPAPPKPSPGPSGPEVGTAPLELEPYNQFVRDSLIRLGARYDTKGVASSFAYGFWPNAAHGRVDALTAVVGGAHMERVPASRVLDALKLSPDDLANRLGDYMQAMGVRDPVHRAQLISNYMGQQTPEAIAQIVRAATPPVPTPPLPAPAPPTPRPRPGPEPAPTPRPAPDPLPVSSATGRPKDLTPFQSDVWDALVAMGAKVETAGPNAQPYAFANAFHPFLAEGRVDLSTAIVGGAWQTQIDFARLSRATNLDAAQIAMRLDQYLESVHKVPNPDRRAVAIYEYLQSRSPQWVVDRYRNATTQAVPIPGPRPAPVTPGPTPPPAPPPAPLPPPRPAPATPDPPRPRPDPNAETNSLPRPPGPTVLGGDALDNALRDAVGRGELGELVGRVVSLQRPDVGGDLGPQTLSDFVGIGAFGALYRTEEGRGTLLKLIHHQKEGPESVTRQLRGERLLSDPSRPGAVIPSPQIRQARRGVGYGDPSYLVVDDLFAGQWARRKAYFKTTNLTREELEAARKLFRDIGERDLVWVDCHRGNQFFFTDERGTLRAGVLDHDMIFPAPELVDAAAAVRTRLFERIGRSEAAGQFAAGNADARALMEAFFARVWDTEIARLRAPAPEPAAGRRDRNPQGLVREPVDEIVHAELERLVGGIAAYQPRPECSVPLWIAHVG